MSAPTTIDLARVPLPDAIETIEFETLQADFISRFQAAWEAERANDSTLPAFTIAQLQANPVVIVGQAVSYLRLLDRQRVNDVVRSVFATTARRADLDALVARQNVQRLVLVPATADAAAVMESDDALLRRYLLSFDRGSAGSAGRYLFEAWTAWPEMADARVNGFAVHGRRGDTDVVIAGPGGRAPTDVERRAVAAAVLALNVKPEAVAVAVRGADVVAYEVRLAVEIPPGPDARLVVEQVEDLVRAAAKARLLIGAEIPAGFFAGIAYGAGNVIRVRDLEPFAIDPDPYAIPVMVGLAVTATVRT